MAFPGPAVTQATQRILTTGDRNVVVCGSFAPQGSSAPTLGTSPGVKKVIRTAQGQFKVTLKEPWKHSLDMTAFLQLNAAADRRAVVQSHTVTSASDPSIVIWVVDHSGVAQDVAANANDQVYFRFVLQNGAVQ
jgi:hypothetical protein